MTVLERLNEKVYVVQHNPNCPSPFLVRLVGRCAGFLDYEPYDITKDVLGFGTTLEEAAEKALSAREEQKKLTIAQLLKR